jgi:hypothetical protein
METKLNSNKVLFNKLNDYFKDNIRISLKCYYILIIITKEDLFYCIDIYNENIPSFIVNNDFDSEPGFYLLTSFDNEKHTFQSLLYAQERMDNHCVNYVILLDKLRHI